MPSTYTLNNGIELIATGEQSGTWGDTTNTNLELLDTALDGQVTVTLSSAGSSGSPNTLPISDGAASNGRNRMVIFDDSSDLGATAYVQLTPNDAEKIIYVRNSLSGGRDIILFQGTYSASNDYNLPNGTTAVIFFDGAGSGAVAANVLSTLQVDALNVESAASTTAITIDNTATDGDPILGFALSGTNTFTMGVDDGDSDKFKIGTTAIGTDTRLSIDSSGNIEIPSGSLTITSANTLTLRNDTATDADEPKITFDNDTFAGANYANIRTGNGGLLLSIESPSTSTYQNRHKLTLNGGAADDLNYSLSTDNGSTYVSYFKIDGGNVTFNETGADADFRVESDNDSHMLFMDASTSRLGIITSAPEYTFDVLGQGRFRTADNSTQLTLESTDEDASGGPTFTLYRNSSSPAANDFIGKVRFEGRNNNSQSFIAAEILTKIQDVADGAEDGDLRIYTMGNGTSNNRLAFYTDKTVFNDDSVDIDFRVESNNYSHMLFVDAANDHINIGGSADSGGMLNVSGDIVLSVGSGNPGVTIKTAGTGNNPHLNYRAGDNIVFDNMLVASASTDYWRVGHGASGSVTTEVLAVTTDSHVGVNLTAPQSSLHINDNGGPEATGNMTSGLIVSNGTTGTAIQMGTNDSGGYGYIKSAYVNSSQTARALLLYAGTDKAVSVESGETVINDDSADRNFRVESDNNANMLVVDAGNDRVGIGCSPASTLMVDVDGAANAGGGDYWDLNKWFVISDGSTNSSSGLGITHTSAGGTYISSIHPYTAWRDLKFQGDQFQFLNGGTNNILQFDNSNFIVNENSLSVDFRVESDGNANMLFLDASSNVVNIGTSSFSVGSDGIALDAGRIRLNKNSDYTIESSGTNGAHVRWYGTAGGVAGTITTTASTTSYNTSSDHRLKENVVDLTGATDRLKQLQPRRFNFIEEADTTVDGFLAHEVQSVVPEAITGTHNEVDADGNPVYQGIDHSKLVPLLVATIKELEARITALENA